MRCLTGNLSDAHPFDVSDILLYLMKEALTSIIDPVSTGTSARDFDVCVCVKGSHGTQNSTFPLLLRSVFVNSCYSLFKFSLQCYAMLAISA